MFKESPEGQTHYSPAQQKIGQILEEIKKNGVQTYAVTRGIVFDSEWLNNFLHQKFLEFGKYVADELRVEKRTSWEMGENDFNQAVAAQEDKRKKLGI